MTDPRTFVSAIDLNQTGRNLQWSIFTVSVANLVLIAAMVVIFGIALLLPLPHRGSGDVEAGTDTSADGDASTVAAGRATS